MDAMLVGIIFLQEKKGTTEDEMVGWHHWLDGNEFEQALGFGDGQGTLVCCSPWGHKESDKAEQCTAQETKPQILTTMGKEA